MEKKIVLIIISILVILIIAGVLLYLGGSYYYNLALNSPNVQNAISVANQFYQYTGTNNPQLAAGLWVNATPALNKRVNDSNYLNSKLGNITSYKLTGFEVTTSDSNQTTEAHLTYQVTRTKFDSVEDLYLIKNSSSESFVIYDYSVTSQGLQAS